MNQNSIAQDSLSAAASSPAPAVNTMSAPKPMPAPMSASAPNKSSSPILNALCIIIALLGIGFGVYAYFFAPKCDETVVNSVAADPTEDNCINDKVESVNTATSDSKTIDEQFMEAMASKFAERGVPVKVYRSVDYKKEDTHYAIVEVLVHPDNDGGWREMYYRKSDSGDWQYLQGGQTYAPCSDISKEGLEVAGEVGMGNICESDDGTLFYQYNAYYSLEMIYAQGTNL